VPHLHEIVVLVAAALPVSRFVGGQPHGARGPPGPDGCPAGRWDWPVCRDQLLGPGGSPAG